MSDESSERDPNSPQPVHPSRRTVLRGAAMAGVAAPLLAACGGGSSDSSSGGGDLPLATSKVPEGGGVILDAQRIVVTQPAAGEFKAFSAVCTHQGCLVNEVAGGTINCACHGSRFSISDGSVVGGPAPSPLPAENVTVKGGKISLA